MHNAQDNLLHLHREHMPVVYEAVNQLCTPGCDDGLWYRSAIELLRNNSIEPYLYAAAMRDLLSKGRGKFRNLLLDIPSAAPM